MTSPLPAFGTGQMQPGGESKAIGQRWDITGQMSGVCKPERTTGKDVWSL
ncbi:MAG: hypothetical protein MUC60_00485 [Oscillatoria sp. Prado101]|nr:hypothetical protein [Oscillatoria sp. Prado101]